MHKSVQNAYLTMYSHTAMCVSLKNITCCCDMGQNDTIGKIELNPSFILSSDNTNCKNDIQ